MALDYGTVQSYNERGFGFVSRTLRQNLPHVFFHIKVIKHKYPDLAAALDDDSYGTLSFWYDTESTDRGDQVRELWLNVGDVPEELLKKSRTIAEEFLLASRASLSPDTARVIQAVLGRPRYHELKQVVEQQRRQRHELAEAEQQHRDEQRRRERELTKAERRQREAKQRRRQEEKDQRPIEQEAKRQRQVEGTDTGLQSQAKAASSQRPTLRSDQDGSAWFVAHSSEVNSAAGTGFWYSQFRTAGQSPAVTETGPRQIETKVVGVTYENRQSVVKKLSEGEAIRLCREPENPHDQNAIRVERLTGEKIGYISRVEAAALAPSFDRQGKPVMATVTAIVHGYGFGSALGVRIRFTVPEVEMAQRPVLPEFRDSWEDQA